MRRKWISMALALALTLALAVPAAAVESGMGNFTAKKAYQSGQFTDVPAGAWYEAALKDCYEAGLMNGKTAAVFAPRGELTGGEALVMAVRVKRIYTGAAGDLPQAAQGQPWYWPAYEYAMNNGIMDKELLTSFDFSAPATRAQMACLFARALPDQELAPINAVEKLPDVELTDNYTDFSRWIYQLYRAGVLTGSDLYGTYRPDDTVTRAEAAAIIARVAFPEQRRTLALYERHTVAGMSFAMPVGSTVETDTGALQAATDDGQMTVVVTDTNPDYRGIAVTDLPADYIESLFKTMFAETGLTLKDFSMEVVAFGGTDSYRIAYTASDETAAAPGSGYLCIDQETMYLCMILDAAGGGGLKTMTNAVTLNGAEVAPKL